MLALLLQKYVSVQTDKKENLSFPYPQTPGKGQQNLPSLYMVDTSACLFSYPTAIGKYEMLNWIENTITASNLLHYACSILNVLLPPFSSAPSTSHQPSSMDRLGAALVVRLANGLFTVQMPSNITSCVTVLYIRFGREHQEPLLCYSHD